MQLRIGSVTTLELCELAGICRSTVQKWLESGLLEARLVGVPGGGCRRELDPGQLEKARLIKALIQKGVPTIEISAADLAFAGQAYVVFDGRSLRPCRDAATAITTVVKAKGKCSAVDLSAIRPQNSAA
jgi:hypothetical protein